MSLHLIHADDHLLVLDKPSGLLAVPGRGPDKQDCLSARVQAEYPDARIVHRLDMDTSGLLITARGTEMQRLLSMAFAARRVRKRYIAVVAGHLAPPDTPDVWGLIDLPLIVDWPNCVFRVTVTGDFAESVTDISHERDRDFALNVTESEKRDVWIDGLASPLYFEASEHAPGATIHAQDPRRTALPPHHRPEP